MERVEPGGNRKVRSTIDPCSQRNARQTLPSHETETPPTCPRVLMLHASLKQSAGRNPRSVTTPSFHRAASFGRLEKTAPPATTPASLIAVAAKKLPPYPWVSTSTSFV